MPPMNESAPSPSGRPPKPGIQDSDVQGGQWIARIMRLPAPLHDHRADCIPKRLLHYDEYCAWLLICFFTPVLDWQIELFFRWFKKILQADRLLSLSQEGLTIVAYCGLIASMLVTLWTGRKPTKRTFELLCFHFLGLLGDEELLRRIERLERRELPR